MRSEEDIRIALENHGDTVRRVSFIHLKNYSDVEDVFQDVFLKYMLHDGNFENKNHEKAWLIRVTVNQCKDLLKSFFRKKVNSIDDVDISNFAVRDEDRYLLDAVLKLPDKYKDVIYLYYYEGYTAVEIAKLLNKRENTIYTWLSRGKSALKDSLGGEFYE